VVSSDEDAEIFYRLNGNDLIEQQFPNQQIIEPARNVWHVRLHCNGQYPRPLVGATPLAAALGDLATYENIKQQQDQFFQNSARPSAVLSTDLNLSAEQVQQLRDRFNDAAKGMHAGGVPILTHDLKVLPWANVAAKGLQVRIAEVEQRKHCAGVSYSAANFRSGQRAARLDRSHDAGLDFAGPGLLPQPNRAGLR
jgi:phage portal protein BeeE